MYRTFSSSLKEGPLRSGHLECPASAEPFAPRKGDLFPLDLPEGRCSS